MRDTEKYLSTLQKIDQALKSALALPESKECSICITRLEEAYLWLDRKHIELQIEKVEDLVKEEVFEEPSKKEHSLKIGECVSTLVPLLVDQRMEIPAGTLGLIKKVHAIGLYSVDFEGVTLNVTSGEIKYMDTPF